MMTQKIRIVLAWLCFIVIGGCGDLAKKEATSFQVTMKGSDIQAVGTSSGETATVRGTKQISGDTVTMAPPEQTSLRGGGGCSLLP